MTSTTADANLATASPEIYPQYCFILSTSVNTWVPLTAVEIHTTLRAPTSELAAFEAQDVYFYGNHPVRWVRACGVVVATDTFGERRIYTIDDGSGMCLECVTTLKQSGCPGSKQVDKFQTVHTGKQGDSPTDTLEPAPMNIREGEQIGVGSTVDVKGLVRVFRQRQIKVVRWKILRSTEEEVAIWEKRNRFWEEVLSVPWVLKPKVVRRCKRIAEKALASDETRREPSIYKRDVA